MYAWTGRVVGALVGGIAVCATASNKVMCQMERRESRGRMERMENRGRKESRGRGGSGGCPGG